LVLIVGLAQTLTFGGVRFPKGLVGAGGRTDPSPGCGLSDTFSPGGEGIFLSKDSSWQPNADRLQ